MPVCGIFEWENIFLKNGMGKHYNYKTWNLEKVNMPVSMLLIMMLQILFVSSASFIIHYMMLIVTVSKM